MNSILFLLGGLSFGAVVGYFVRQAIAVRKTSSLERKIKAQAEEAKTKSREIVLEARDKAAALFEEVKKEEGNRKKKLDDLQGFLIKKEETLEKQTEDLNAGQKNLSKELGQIDFLRKEAEGLKKKASDHVAKLAGMSVNEAKDVVIKTAKETHAKELSSVLGNLEKERADELKKKSVDIITTALQRYARTHVSEMTTSTLDLPNEDLKGKIIGREGRNIRALERLTGVELIVDEAPDSVVISSFDPARREVARLALDKLVKDGRIQPAKIEEKVDEARKEIDKRMVELGESACYELGILDFPKEIVNLIGQLHFRTSYGQNVLTHSIEMGHIAGVIASELGLDVETTKKAALVHDIGKAINHEVEGTHVELGRKLLKKYGVDEKIIKAMESHHEDYPYSISEAFVVTAADVLSGARPGARRDSVENFIKRLENLEKIATGFDSVKSAYAISGGR